MLVASGKFLRHWFKLTTVAIFDHAQACELAFFPLQLPAVITFLLAALLSLVTVAAKRIIAYIYIYKNVPVCTYKGGSGCCIEKLPVTSNLIFVIKCSTHIGFFVTLAFIIGQRDVCTHAWAKLIVTILSAHKCTQ